MNILFKLSEELNILCMAYQQYKGQNSFEILKRLPLPLEFNEHHRSVFKEFLKERNKEFPLDLLSIYLQAKRVWDRYWATHKETLQNALTWFNKRAESFDFLTLDRASRFFESAPPKEVAVYICMGNESILGTGNAFKPNTCFIFLRNFPHITEASLEQDFAVLAHELVHLSQGCKEVDKTVLEKIICAFAPRGLLINRDKVKKGSKEEMQVKFIEEKINSNKTIKDLAKGDLAKFGERNNE